ncbi:hypothetical protein EJB05_02703, partial [Eragrostis curvula]
MANTAMASSRAAALATALLFVVMFEVGVVRGQLQVGFYSDSCPDAEDVVTAAVQDAAGNDPTILPALLRLQFHDCFVKLADALSVHECLHQTGGPAFDIPTGRRDGLTSNLRDADALPDADDPIDSLRSRFAAAGLTDRDLVLLTAAHTVGTTACFFVKDRLYNFPLGAGRRGADPSIPAPFLAELKSRCAPGDLNTRLPLDRGSEARFDDSILRNIRSGQAVIASDAALVAGNATRAIVDAYLGAAARRFQKDFADAMVRMGSIGAITGDDGEVRDVCSAFNSN